VIDLAIIVVRLVQYAAAAVLFGLSLFFVYARPLPRGRAILASAGGLLALASLLAIGLQASLFAGSFAQGATVDAMADIVGYLPLGKAALVRAATAAAAFVLVLALPAGRETWLSVAALGMVATASLAWMGHGAASDGSLGWVHLAADVLHALSGAIWLGALAGLAVMVCDRASRDLDTLLLALRRFSAFAPLLIAVVVLSGLVNGWVLVGPDRAFAMADTPYGQLLIVKLILFAAMLALGAVNRWRLTPALAADPGPAAMAQLKWSIGVETAAGLAILGLVAWFGTLVPPAAA